MALWATDGSPAFFSYNCVTYKGATLCNAIWKEGVSSGTHYWKIHFEASGGRVGISCRDYFKKPHASRSFMYSGDLRVGVEDEDDLEVANFGPPPKKGDVIGILSIFEKDKLYMYIDVNGKSLGLAFVVAISNLVLIFPMVTFYHSGAATCTKQTEIPDLTIRVPGDFHGIEGDWKMIEFDKIEVKSRNPMCKIRKIAQNNYYWNINPLHTQIKRANGKWESDVVETDDKMRQPELNELEQALKRLMNYVFQVDILDNDLLDIRSLPHTSLWQRHEDPPQPFIDMPFRSSKKNSLRERHKRHKDPPSLFIGMPSMPFRSSEID